MKPSPLGDGSLARWQVLAFNISQLTLDAVKPFGLGNKEALRCKNMWTLGLALWMFDRDRQPLIDWLKAKFAKAPTVGGGQHCRPERGPCLWRDGRARPHRIKQHHRRLLPPPSRACIAPITGAEAISMGLVAGAQLAGAADVLWRLSDHAGLGDPAPFRRG